MTDKKDKPSEAKDKSAKDKAEKKKSTRFDSYLKTLKSQVENIAATTKADSKLSEKVPKGKPLNLDNLIKQLKTQVDNLINSATGGAKGKPIKAMDIVNGVLGYMNKLIETSKPKKPAGQAMTLNDYLATAETVGIKLLNSTAGNQGPPRPMKYPYTFSAKLAQFPWKFYFTKQWIWKNYAYALIVCIPIFKYFSGMANTKDNRKKWKEIRRKEKMSQHH